MITMVDRQQIIHMYRTLGHSKRAIGRALDINRKTVAKVIQEYESSLASSDPEGSLETLLTRKPVYDSSSRRRKVITGALQELIDTCLRDNVRKRATGLKKQCMVGIDIYELVLSKGFKVSYSGVCKYIKEVKEGAKPSSKEAFMRGYHPPVNPASLTGEKLNSISEANCNASIWLFLLLAIVMAVMPGSFAIKTPWLLWSHIAIFSAR